MGENDDIKSVLIIRSTAVVFERAVSEMLRLHPRASLSALVPPDIVGEMPPNVEAIPYGWRRFSRRLAGRSYLDDLRERKFDLVLALYNNLDGAGYGNVEEFALSLGAKYVAYMNASGEMRAITRKTFRVGGFLELARRISALLSSAVAAFVFGVVFTSVLALDLFTLVFGAKRREATGFTREGKKGRLKERK
ncbi:MAG: hypothetical protein ACUVXI_02335 [bacterium]